MFGTGEGTSGANDEGLRSIRTHGGDNRRRIEIAAPVARADETCLSPYTAALIKGQGLSACLDTG